MDAAYYADYYTLERRHWWFAVRARIVADLVGALPANAELLNVGVATGATSELLAARGRVTSVEYDAGCCAFLADRVRLPRLVRASACALPFADDAFDLVAALDVIEHIADDLRAVRELLRVLRPGGRLLLTVPALMLLWSHHDEVNQHERRYTRSQLVRLVRAAGGRVVWRSYFNTLLFPPILGFRLLSRLIPPSLVRKQAGSDFTVVDLDNPVNRAMGAVFGAEQTLLRRGVDLPIGVSVALIAERADWCTVRPVDLINSQLHERPGSARTGGRDSRGSPRPSASTS